MPNPNALQDLADSLAPYLAGTDATAIHVDVADEITQITLKAAPLIDDVAVIEDTAAAAAKKRITLGTVAKMPGQVTALTAATILVTDLIAFEDASATLAMKKALVQEVFAAPGWMTGVAAATPLAADVIVFEDASDTLAIKKTTVGALPIAQAQVAGIALQPAADAAVAILGTTRGVQLVVTGASNIAISTGAGVYAGQVVNLFALAVAGGGSYTLALDVGTLTLNAASEGAVVERNTGNTAWICIGLAGGTIV